MATIFDYLEWRGDLSFSADPFNEVDNLVLAELAYTDFRGIVPEDGREIPLQEAYEAFFAIHSREEIAKNKSFTAKAPLLMDGMIKGQRFQGMTLSHYIDERGEDLQLSAVTFRLGDGTCYAAFRGTDGTVAGWREDFDFTFLNETEGQRRAVTYLNGLSGKLRVGGHSKGGNLAVYAAAFCGDQKKILKVYNNDGPGFREEITRKEGFQRIVSRAVSIVPEGSVIGLLLSGQYERKVIRSSASGITQHDGFTWQVKGNRFEGAKLSEMSRLIDQTIGGWLATMNDETRQSFVETIFTMIESTGKERFSSMSEEKWKSAEAMIGAVRNMPREKQQESLKLLGLLGQSSGQALLNYVTGLIEKNL